jgi:hypothetical protein
MCKLLTLIIILINIGICQASNLEILPLDRIASVTYFDISKPNGANSKRFGTILPVLRHKAGLSLSVGFALPYVKSEGSYGIVGVDYLFDDMVRGTLDAVGVSSIPLLRRVTDSIQTGVYYGYDFSAKAGAIGVYLGFSLDLKPAQAGSPRAGWLQARPASYSPERLSRF